MTDAGLNCDNAGNVYLSRQWLRAVRFLQLWMQVRQQKVGHVFVGPVGGMRSQHSQVAVLHTLLLQLEVNTVLQFCGCQGQTTGYFHMSFSLNLSLSHSLPVSVLLSLFLSFTLSPPPPTLSHISPTAQKDLHNFNLLHY